MPETPSHRYKHLTGADTVLLKRLLFVFGEAFEDRRTYQDAVPTDAYLERLLCKEHFIVLDGSGDVIGGLTAYVLDKFEMDRREIYIYDLAVAETHRRRGVATGLIESLRAIARERDAYVIFVQADLVDAPAIALYDKMGIKETAHDFDIDPAQ